MKNEILRNNEHLLTLAVGAARALSPETSKTSISFMLAVVKEVRWIFQTDVTEVV